MYGVGPLIGPMAPSGLGGPGMMDPSSNNAPLQFNNKKGKPALLGSGPNNGMHGDMDLEQGQLDSSSPGTNMPNMGGGMAGNMGGGHMGSGPMGGPGQMQGNPGQWGGPMNSMMNPNMMGMDPSMMMGGMQYGGYGGYMGGMPMDGGGPMTKEVITLKSCVMYPPPPNAPPPSTRERPPGCRTIFVGGLPENMTEDVLREIYDNCGPITSLRMSKKNFAHIRFEMEESVERALYLSGYRIKMEDKDDKPNTGRIHVDYAQARDDLYEWECKVRMLQREERHRQRMEEDRLRPPSPPPVSHFSDHEAGVLIEQLKGNESFYEASKVLVTWLERGDCNRKNANSFYSLIQCVNAHIRRLLTEKQEHDDDLAAMKYQFRARLEHIIQQFEQIEQVFGATSKQKAWDHFTKAQRKNIDTWRKQAKEVSRSQREQFLKEREEAEMEMSDSEDAEPSVTKKKKITDPAEYAQAAMLEWQSNQLREENDSMKCQLEAYKNEVDLLKHDLKGAGDEKDKQVKTLQAALKGMQQQLIQAKNQIKEDTATIKTLKLTPAPAASATEQVSVVIVDADAEKAAAADADDGTSPTGAEFTAEVKLESPTVTPVEGLGLGEHSTLPEKEAKVLALLSTFLVVHPFGASVDYIWSYLHGLNIRVKSGELEDLMERYPGLYRLDIRGVGASIEKRWKFVAYDPVNNLAA